MRPRLSWLAGIGGMFLVCLFLWGAAPSGVLAAEMRISAPEVAPETVQLSGPWAAWDDYNVTPAVVRWRNLETGAQGTVAVPDLNGRKGTQWTVGAGFVIWNSWSDGADGGLYAEKLLTHEQRKLTDTDDTWGGFVTDGSLLYWVEGAVLNRLDMSNGVTKTFPAPGDVYNFDVGGDWIAWATFEELDPDALEWAGYTGTVHARNLVSGEELVLGSIFWGTMQEAPPVPSVDGRWVVWYGYTSPMTLDAIADKAAYAYDLQSRQLIALDERVGSSQDPNGLRVSDGWIVWTNWSGANARSYVMNLAHPSAVPRPVAKTPGSQYGEGVDSPWVVWSDDRDSTNDSGEYSVYARRIDDTPAEAFSDIADSEYQKAIEALAAANVIGGYSDGTFRPENTVLRAQFAKMLVGALGLDVFEGAVGLPFTDVERPDDNLYPDDYIAVAAANGIVNGFDATTFGPYLPVTRIQMVSMVVRALERLRPDRLQQPPSHWGFGFPEASDPVHGRSVQMAEYNGLITYWGPESGSGTGSLWDAATRGEMAELLWNALGAELPLPSTISKATTSLADLETQLRAQLDPGSSIYLPEQLPAGWALAQTPLASNSGWNWSSNPEIESGGYYEVAFTNGSSLIFLRALSTLGDIEPFTEDIPTDLPFEGTPIEMFYSNGAPICYWFGDSQPPGWTIWAINPWNRDDVLAFAAAMKRVARPSELTPDEVKVLSGWGDPQDLTVRSYQLFGLWATAIIDVNAPAPPEGPPPMGCICVFRYESSRWTLFDQSSFIGEIDLFPRLRTEGVPEWLIQWTEAQMGF